MKTNSRHITSVRLRPATAVWLLLVAAVIAGCATIRMDTPARTSDADWLTEGDTVTRLHHAAVQLPPPLEEAWTYNAGAGFGRISPLLLQDVVFVATRKGEVHGIDWETGKKRGLKGFGESIEGTPVIDGGRLFIPVAWGRKVLHAYDLRGGKSSWLLRDVPIESGLLVYDDHVIAADVESRVRAYATSNGEQVWSWQGDSTATVFASLVLTQTPHIVVADEKGTVTALRPSDGREAWSTSVRAPVHQSFAAAENRLYLSTTRGHFVALESTTGDEIWRFDVGDESVRLSAPAVADGVAYVGTTRGNVYAIDTATGAVRWTSEGEEGVSAPPLITDTHVYVGTLDRKLIAIDRQNGERVWEVTLKGRVKSAMAARDGGLIVLAEPRIVYKFVPAGGEVVADGDA